MFTILKFVTLLKKGRFIMKKFFVIFVSFFALTSFFSCSKKANENGGKITLASFAEHPKYAFEEAIAAANLPFEVEIIEYLQSEYESKIKLAFSAKTSTDLILMDAPNIASYASQGVLEALDSYWDKTDFDDLVDSSKTSMRWDRKIWAAPLNEANTLLFYNKKVFEKHGIKAPTKVSEAWTLDELYEVCKKVVAKNADGTISMYAIQPQMVSLVNKHEGMTFTQLAWLNATGGDVLSKDGEKATGYFNSAEAKRGIDFYGKLFREKLATTEDIVNAFESEKVAMWVTGPWMLGIWNDNFPDVQKWWGAMPMPKDVRGASGSGSWNIAMSAQSKNKEKAWLVIKAITGKEGASIWSGRTGNVPARKSILESESRYSEYPFDIISDQLVETAISRPVTPVYPQISEAVVDAFAEMAFGGEVNDVADRAAKKMDAALATVKQ